MTINKTTLIGLTADRFRHPLDLEATNALKQLPGIDIAIRSVLGSVAEQFFYLNNIASSVLVSEKQLPHIHKLLIEACQILDLEPPQLYLQQTGSPFCSPGFQPFIFKIFSFNSFLH